MHDKIVVIIPAYNPDEKLIMVLKNLSGAGFQHIIIVDDGSEKECAPVFEMATDIMKTEKMGGVILRHSINLGQGRAYKTAFNYYLEHYSDFLGVIQCDADGQHLVDDAVKCAQLLEENASDFILGVRNFNKAGIPFRSRFGNKLTNLIFRLCCGINIKDTQTGLKGIPTRLIPYLMEAPGERFEYATSVLLEVNKRNVPIRQFEIQTVYIDGNKSSHFNPVLDSVRIYSLLCKYIISSLSAFIIDIIIFAVCISLLKNVMPEIYIFVSTYIAKVFSCTYSFFVNKKLVFNSQNIIWIAAIKFIVLCIAQAGLSSIFVNYAIPLLRWNEVFVKIIVDTMLFFFSFQVQNRWVFKERRDVCRLK